MICPGKIMEGGKVGRVRSGAEPKSHAVELGVDSVGFQ